MRLAAGDVSRIEVLEDHSVVVHNQAVRLRGRSTTCVK
jgi:hypothetical protein